MIDLPYTALVGAVVSVEPVDLAWIEDLLSSEDDRSRRHEDWHADFPREDDLDAVGMVTDLTGWAPRAVRRTTDGLVVGTLGFFGPPEAADDGVPEVEVGFGLVEDARGQGLMGEALPALMVLIDQVGVRVRAHAAPDNEASLATLRKAGFVERGPDEAELRLVRAPR